MPNPNKTSTVRVEKTEKLDQRKLKVVANRYGIAPINVRELQLGFSEDIPRVAAELLEKDGFVKRVKSKPRPMQERVDSLTTEHTEPIATVDDETVVTADGDDGTTSDPVEEEEHLNG